MNEETYNGWANRETWAFNLHWSNDQGLYDLVLAGALEWLRSAGFDGDEEPTDYDLGAAVVEMVQDELPELSPELWELMRSDVGSFWRIDLAETGASVRESLGNES